MIRPEPECRRCARGELTITRDDGIAIHLVLPESVCTVQENWKRFINERKDQMIRQGDVLLIPINKNSTTAGDAIAPDGDRVVLAHGEATGHAHAVAAKLATLYVLADTADRLLRVLGPGALLRHEEHGHVPLPEGDYIVRRQREYTPERPRKVAD